ncbi:MAG: FAD:protein FMN transferase [Gemmatimonadetes bacterium]|nr:MAG: FAD:protein FMN transferase [Gemmatimonadota bacterium]
MTQFMGYRGFSLARAPLSLKLLVSAFLLLASLGVAVGVLNYQVRTGLTVEGSGAWYRGTPAGVRADPVPGPDDLDAPIALDAKTPLELLDATHPHLFNQAFLIFLLGHLTALCALSPRLKTALYVGGFLGVLIDTASPWLIRYGGAGFAWLQLAGHVVLALSFLGLVGAPLREMWWRGRSGAGRAGALLLIATAASTLQACAGGADAGPVEVTRAWPVMGTMLSVTVRATDSTTARRAVEAARAAVFRVDTLMSTYRADSEVSHLNRTAGSGAWTPLDPWTEQVLRAALHWAGASDGAFDPTVGPLMEVWGFRGPQGPHRPERTELDEARARVDWRAVRLDTLRHAARLERPDMALDFGAIAKGFAVDRAVEAVRRAGAQAAMVDLGGNIGVWGPAPDGAAGWTLGVRHPRRGDDVLATLTLADGAVATSGDYEQSFVENGVRYSHLMDPRSGEPVRGVVAVTVAAPDGITADVLSTALFVLGPDAGRRLLERAFPEGGVTALWVLDDPDGTYEADDLVVVGDAVLEVFPG